MMHEALIFADDRPMSTSDDLYQWATDAETLIRQQHASLAAAQAEIARLRGALSALELSANTVARCYTHRPENFASALQSLESDASAARELLK